MGYRRVTLEDVRRALAQERPGDAAHRRMALRPLQSRAEPDVRQPHRQSGVLLLLYPCADRLCFVLTRRTEKVLTHRGQISFPGGAQEPGDLSLAHTALREAEEELGISLADAEPLGALTSYYIARTNYDVHPLVAYLPLYPAFRPNTDEVAELLEIPVEHLLDRSRLREEEWTLRGDRVIVPFWWLGGHKVWGATGTVLAEFALMLEQATCDRPQEPPRPLPDTCRPEGDHAL